MVVPQADRLERCVLFATLVSIMLPLTLERGAVGLAPFSILLPVLLLLGLGRAAVREEFPRVDVFDALLLVLGAWVASATILNAPENLSKLMLFEAGLLLGIYANHSYRRSYGYAFIYRFAIAAIVLQVGICLLQLVTFSSIGDVRAYFGETRPTEPHIILGALNRAVGTLGAPNLLGNWLLLLMPFLYVRFATKHRTARRSVAASHCLLWMSCIFIMLLSLSRWNLLAALGSVALFWWIERWQDGLRPSLGRFLRVAGVAVAGGAAVALLAFAFREEISLFLQFASVRFAETSSSASLRLEQYRGALISMAVHPLLGVGFGGSREIWDFVNVNLPGDWIYAPHSVYLILGTEAGLPGLALFLAAVALPVSLYVLASGRAPISATVLFVSVTMYLIVASVYVLPIEHGLWPLFMFLLGALHREVRCLAHGTEARS